jgi:hypothetical protein
MCQCWKVRLHNVPVLTQSVSSTRTPSSFVHTFAGRLDSAHQCLGKVCVSQKVCPICDLTRCVPEAPGGGLMLEAHDKVVGVPSDLAERAARNLAASGLQALRSAVRTTNAAFRRPPTKARSLSREHFGGVCHSLNGLHTWGTQMLQSPPPAAFPIDDASTRVNKC